MFLDAASHVFPPTQWEMEAAQSIGFHYTTFRFTLAFLMSVPVAILFRHIPSVTGRHIYAVMSGFLLIYFPFGNGCFHAVVSSTVVYAGMVVVPKHCGTLSWVFSFPYLIGNHIYQASGMSWKEGQLDFTGAQMILTLKLVAVAMCYQDGMRKMHPTKMHSYAASKRLERLPTILEYMSYLFAAGNLLSGPFFEARDYFDYVERKGDWDERKPDGRIPNPLVPGTYRFVKGIMCASIWIYFTNYGFSIEFIESETWREGLPFVLRCLSLWATIVVYRFKYYGVWCMAESGLIFSGFGYRNRDENGHPRWDRYLNSHIRQVELNPSLADTPRHWNICTGLWLRHYVYERISKPGAKPSFFNMVVTQLVSGVWHGIFAGYWLFFATSAFMFQASRVLYKYESTWPKKWRNFWLWYCIKVLMSALVLSYSASAFVVLSFLESLLIWKSCLYFGHIWIALLIALGLLLPPRKANITKHTDTKTE